MSEAVEVLLWGRRIGVASRVDGAPCASFAYDREFRDAGIEPSPLMMPVGIAAYSFPALPQGNAPCRSWKKISIERAYYLLPYRVYVEGKQAKG